MRTEKTIKQLRYAKQFHKLNGLVVNAIDDAIECLEERERVCGWRLSTVLDCVLWHAVCGMDWQFANPEATPEENEMVYCPKCGRKIEVAE